MLDVDCIPAKNTIIRGADNSLYKKITERRKFYFSTKNRSNCSLIGRKVKFSKRGRQYVAQKITERRKFYFSTKNLTNCSLTGRKIKISFGKLEKF